MQVPEHLPLAELLQLQLALKQRIILMLLPKVMDVQLPPLQYQ